MKIIILIIIIIIKWFIIYFFFKKRKKRKNSDINNDIGNRIWNDLTGESFYKIFTQKDVSNKRMIKIEIEIDW